MKSLTKLLLATVSLFGITAVNAADINVRIVNLTNGIYFTPFLVAVHPAGSSLLITGGGAPGVAGIPEKDIPRIFDRFYRAVSGEETRSGSSGLGLAIVKRILDLHDSRITVESRLNRGTRFEFELPIYREAA